MKFTRLDIPDVVLVEPTRHGDGRGFFSETYRADRFAEAIGRVRFVQDNHSRSMKRGTVRGLHAQIAPRAQGKLVRVTRGAILDVAVDARSGSPTFGRCVAAELSAENWRQLWVPPGFMHGFCTLVDDVEVIYKVTALYSREHEVSVRWNDPAIAAPWPVAEADAVLSDKDAAAPLLAEHGVLFRHRASRRHRAGD
jgi:dTDP-4-dehydrorhamnose 3,5-epimerase